MEKKFLVLAALILTACSPGVNKKSDRVEFVSAAVRHDARVDSPLLTSVDQGSEGACERVDYLAKQALNSNEKYSVFADISGGNARMNVSENPLAQLILGEKFKLSTEDEFFQLVKDEYAKGNIGFFKMFFVRVLKFVGAIDMVQYSATNDKIAESFPGIFGDSGELNKALLYKLSLRAVKQQAPADLNSILTKKLPLFSGVTWSDFTADSRLSLSAAIRAWRSDDLRERACAYVLLHRGFAQMIAIKGYHSPEIKGDSVEKISKPDTEFKTIVRSGGFVKSSTNQAIALTPDEIKDYDPEKDTLRPRAQLPFVGSNDSGGSLGDALAMMEGMLFHYETTSPASPWVDVKFQTVRKQEKKLINGAWVVTGEKTERDIVSSNYMLGDISAESGIAVLPTDANSLSLGLVMVHLKNLKANHIKMVTRLGVLAGEKDPVAGIVLSETGASDRAEVNLDSVLRLMRVTAYLEGALSRFDQRTAEEWAKINEAYSSDLLNALNGDGGAREGLNKLKLGAVVLINEFIKDGRCASQLDWDLRSGARRAVSACTAKQQKEIADALEVLARSTHSEALFKRADSLRSRR